MPKTLRPNQCISFVSSLEEQVLRLELVPEVRAEDEDEVVDDVAEAAEDDERPATVTVRPGAGEERVEHGGQGLQHAVVGLGYGLHIN